VLPLEAANRKSSLLVRLPRAGKPTPRLEPPSSSPTLVASGTLPRSRPAGRMRTLHHRPEAKPANRIPSTAVACSRNGCCRTGGEIAGFRL